MRGVEEPPPVPQNVPLHRDESNAVDVDGQFGFEIVVAVSVVASILGSTMIFTCGHVGDGTGEGVGDAAGVGVGVAAGVGDGTGVGVGVAAGVGVGVAAGVGVATGVGVGVAAGVGVATGEGVGDAAGEGVGVGDADGASVVMFRVQPPAIEPPSAETKSLT